MSLIDRYILRAVLTPLILALGIAAMLLLLEQMLRLFDFVLAEQGPVDVVGRMLANLVPHYLGLALPLGVFLGVMLAFRGLSLSSELDALSSGGISFARLLRPVYLLIFALLIFDFILVAYIQPYGRYQYKQIRYDVTSGAFGMRIQPGEFIRLADGVTIRLGAINRETREATDVFVERVKKDRALETITAKTASLSATPDLTLLNMTLFDGKLLLISPDGKQITTSAFGQFNQVINLPSILAFRARGEDVREVTFTELVKVLREGRAVHPEYYDAYRAGFHWRLLQPLSFLILPLLAVGMGVTGRRRASNVKPIVGLAILIAYHEIVQEWGQVMVIEGKASPYVTIWGLFAVFALISFLLYNKAIDQARHARLGARLSHSPIRLASATVVAKAAKPESQFDGLDGVPNEGDVAKNLMSEGHGQSLPKDSS